MLKTAKKNLPSFSKRYTHQKVYFTTFSKFLKRVS